MSPARLLLLIVFPAVAGLWIQFHVDRTPEAWLAEGTCPIDPDELETPPVGASNQWGQHTPARDDPAQVATNAQPGAPGLPENSFLHPQSSVIGSVEIGELVFVAPFASIRAGRELPVRLGARSNVQDGAVVHGLGATTEHSHEIDGRRYSVYLGERVSVSAQAQIHGPARLEDDVFVGEQALVSRSRIGHGSVIEPAAKVIGVEIPPGRYVAAGSLVNAQAVADALPQITFSYGWRGVNRAAVRLNTQLAESRGASAATPQGN